MGLVADGGRFGAARDLVVGMSFVRADGVLAKGGGKVVKNVAGFDSAFCRAASSTTRDSGMPSLS